MAEGFRLFFAEHPIAKHAADDSKSQRRDRQRDAQPLVQLFQLLDLLPRKSRSSS